jgi:hypothetical protein
MCEMAVEKLEKILIERLVELKEKGVLKGDEMVNAHFSDLGRPRSQVQSNNDF